MNANRTRNKMCCWHPPTWRTSRSWGARTFPHQALDLTLGTWRCSLHMASNCLQITSYRISILCFMEIIPDKYNFLIVLVWGSFKVSTASFCLKSNIWSSVICCPTVMFSRELFCTRSSSMLCEQRPRWLKNSLLKCSWSKSLLKMFTDLIPQL